MMGSGPVADTKSVEQVQSLLSIIADPKSAKTALANLAEAQKQADDKLAQANAAASALKQREADLGAREAKLTAGEDALARVMEKQRAYEATTNADLQSRMDAVIAREIAASKADNEANALKVEVVNRELAVTDRETAVKAKEDAAAEAKRSYDEKLANMRSLVSQ